MHHKHLMLPFILLRLCNCVTFSSFCFYIHSVWQAEKPIVTKPLPLTLQHSDISIKSSNLRVPFSLHWHLKANTERLNKKYQDLEPNAPNELVHKQKCKADRKPIILLVYILIYFKLAPSALQSLWAFGYLCNLDFSNKNLFTNKQALDKYKLILLLNIKGKSSYFWVLLTCYYWDNFKISLPESAIIKKR